MSGGAFGVELVFVGIDVLEILRLVFVGMWVVLSSVVDKFAVGHCFKFVDLQNDRT